MKLFKTGNIAKDYCIFVHTVPITHTYTKKPQPNKKHTSWIQQHCDYK